MPHFDITLFGVGSLTTFMWCNRLSILSIILLFYSASSLKQLFKDLTTGCSQLALPFGKQGLIELSFNNLLRSWSFKLRRECLLTLRPILSCSTDSSVWILQGNSPSFTAPQFVQDESLLEGSVLWHSDNLTSDHLKEHGILAQLSWWGEVWH